MRSSQPDNLWPHEPTTTSLRRRETPHSVENYPRNTPAKLSGSRASKHCSATRIQKAIHAPHARATQWQLCQPLAPDNLTAQHKRSHRRAARRQLSRRTFHIHKKTLPRLSVATHRPGSRGAEPRRAAGGKAPQGENFRDCGRSTKAKWP